MEGMTNQDFESFENALLGETASFALKVRGDPEVGPLFRDLEIVLMPDGQRAEDSFKTFTVNLPLTELALEYYRQAYLGALQALDGSLITRQVASLDSFPRKKAAMAAVEALQKASQEFLNDADDSLLELIRLQDMISLAGPVGDDPLDPFELFTDEERIVGEKAAKDKFLDKSLAEQRRPHSHWTGIMNHYEIHSVAQLLEAGTTVFTAQIKINGKSVQRDLHVYACPGPEEGNTSHAKQSVALSSVLVRRDLSDIAGKQNFPCVAGEWLLSSAPPSLPGQTGLHTSRGKGFPHKGSRSHARRCASRSSVNSDHLLPRRYMTGERSWSSLQRTNPVETHQLPRPKFIPILRTSRHTGEYIRRVSVFQSGASNATSIMPLAPPPSLVSSNSSAASRRPSYSRSYLISLAQTPQLPSGVGDRLAKFSPILRNGSLSSHWGEDESLSSLLDDKPIAALMPIPAASHTSSTTSSPISSVAGAGVAPAGEVLFEFLPSASADAPPPIRMVFKDPFSSPSSSAPSSPGDALPRRIPAAHALGVSRASTASTASSDYPSELASFATSTIGMGTITSSTLGREFDSLRLARAASPSSSVSSGSADDANWRRPSVGVAKDRKQSLNRFAAPWPLPDTTPIIRANSASPVPTPAPAPHVLGIAGAADDPGRFASLPLPKHASLPAKPGPIAPVFVRRESAALAQPMSLPHVQPMGRGWEGELGLSGNERRRRASEAPVFPAAAAKDAPEPSVPMRQGSWSDLSSNASSAGDTGIDTPSSAGPRPARLVKLGQGLRANAKVKA